MKAQPGKNNAVANHSFSRKTNSSQDLWNCISCLLRQPVVHLCSVSSNWRMRWEEEENLSWSHHFFLLSEKKKRRGCIKGFPAHPAGSVFSLENVPINKLESMNNQLRLHIEDYLWYIVIPPCLSAISSNLVLCSSNLLSLMLVHKKTPFRGLSQHCKGGSYSKGK